MNCIFCKLDSSKSKSVEHILPESIGNTKYTLPPGIVCDKCNNYFSREVEKPFLESPMIHSLRFRQGIPSKKGIIPSVKGVVLPDIPAQIQRFKNDDYLPILDIHPSGIEQVLNSKKGAFIYPINIEYPTEIILSRFVAKTALEAMAQKLITSTDGLEYIVNERQLDPIRNHARRGDIRKWPINIRRIYDENKKWGENSNYEYQIVHEYDILKTDWHEWFFVLAIFGLEFVINFGGPEISGYKTWLMNNNNISPLYYGKNS